MKTLALVSCGKNKLSREAKAKELYIGELFKKARNNAETNYDKWLILSALHGVVDPESLIEPYDYTLIGKTKEVVKLWSDEVFVKIKETIGRDTIIHIYAGNDYRKFLIPLLESEGYTVDVPLKGLGIGQQLGWYKNNLRSD